jgi:hypothetical protein
MSIRAIRFGGKPQRECESCKKQKEGKKCLNERDHLRELHDNLRMLTRTEEEKGKSSNLQKCQMTVFCLVEFCPLNQFVQFIVRCCAARFRDNHLFGEHMGDSKRWRRGRDQVLLFRELATTLTLP